MEKLDDFGDSSSYLGQLGELFPRSPLNHVFSPQCYSTGGAWRMLVFYLILDIKVAEGHKIIVIVTLSRSMNWAALDTKYILLKYQLGKVGVSSNKKKCKTDR